MDLIQDQRLELLFLSSLADLSTYDMKSAKKIADDGALTDMDFSLNDYWNGFAAIRSCIQAGIPASPDNVQRELQKTSPKSMKLTLAITSESSDVSGEWAAGYLTRLIDVSERRRLHRLLTEMTVGLEQGKPAGETKMRLSSQARQTRGTVKTIGLDSIVEGVEAHLQQVADGKVEPVLPWYIHGLDKALGGLQKTLILIGAEPGVGKSALMAAGVQLQARNGHKPFVASLEDEPSWLAWRLVSSDSKIDQFKMRFVKLADSTLTGIKKENRDRKEERSRIRVVDGSEGGLRIDDLCSSIEHAIDEEGCDSVWIDHLGEIPLTNNERPDLEISRNLSLLRGIANSRGVPMVVATHFKRAVDPKAGPHPSHFANSAGSERKARVAIGLTRTPGSDVLRCHIMKQTNGPAGQIVDLNFAGTAAMVINSENEQ